MTWLELPADHDFTAFLSQVTTADVERDEVAHFSSEERQRMRYLVEQRDDRRSLNPSPKGRSK